MKKKHDYYTVKLPGDYRLTLEGLLAVAIAEVQYRVRLPISLCEWRAWVVEGYLGDPEIVIRVRRTRNKESIYV